MTEEESQALIETFPPLPGEDDPYEPEPGEMEAIYKMIEPLMRINRRKFRLKQMAKLITLILFISIMAWLLVPFFKS